MLLGHKPIITIGCRIKRGDIVRLADKPSHVADFKFKILNSEDRITHTVLKSQTGVVLCEHPDDWGTYNVAFGNVVIVAFENYFDKVEKSLNKS